LARVVEAAYIADLGREGHGEVSPATPLPRSNR
jgi:hypothetical protein